MKKVFFFLLLLVSISITAQAKYIQTCKVKYKTNYSWSEYYTVEVTFMSGNELNRATKTYDYEGYSTYGIVFWSKEQVSIIKISSYTGCGTEANQNCIANKISNLEGEDQEGRDWEICSKNLCY